VILDAEENRLAEPIGYTPDVEEYKMWLESGLKK
jgi:thiol:disulfide interchange protein DsbD